MKRIPRRTFTTKQHKQQGPSNTVRSTIVAISTTSHHPAHRREMNPEVFRDLLI